MLQNDGSVDIDARGPCGMTPLMVAAVRGGGMDTGEDEEEDSTAAVIADLGKPNKSTDLFFERTYMSSLT